MFLDGRERHTFRPPEWRRHVLYSAAEPAWWDADVAPHFPASTMTRTRELCARLALRTDIMDGPVIGLSTGERQRLALIRALIREPSVLLLDEPTGALDEANTSLVEAVLRDQLAHNVTILIVSHNPEQADRLGNRILHMSNRHLLPAAT